MSQRLITKISKITKTQKTRAVKITNASAVNLAYRRLAKKLRTPVEPSNHWINFAALRFCAFALNSK
jgi:hypothetical protein